MSDEQQIAALREEIRRTGSGMRVAWCGTFLPVAVGIIVSLALTGVVAGYTSMGILSVFLALTGASICACVTTWSCRSHQVRRIGERLASLPHEARVAAVSPLLRDSEEQTQKMAALLLTRLRKAGEISPAPRPDGRGEEVAVAERSRAARLED